MNKPKALKKGDRIAVVSLSSGILGEPFIEHEVTLATKRLEEYGLEVVYMPHSLMGIDYIANHPEDRAKDLKQAIQDPSIQGIICALGGDDTYRTIPFLMEDPEFRQTVQDNPKIFIGFSDTTVNHLMFYQLGLVTYYGPCLAADIAELSNEMLPFTRLWFEQLFHPTLKQIESSPVWYMERPNYSTEQLGIPRTEIKENRGYETLRGTGIVTGKLLGGCIDSLGCLLHDEKHPNQPIIAQKYNLFPNLETWKDTLFFFETSEEKMNPEQFKDILIRIKNQGVFEQIKGILVGKPVDEIYYDEYKQVLCEVLKSTDIPILYNVNFGHATPRCILPYGLMAEVDYDRKTITLQESLVD